MCLNEDEQHQDRKPLVTDDKNNRRNLHVMHSSRKYQCDVHTEQINARQGVNDDINKNGYQQLEGDKNNSSINTDDIKKMMCNLLLHQSAWRFKVYPLKYHYFMSVVTETVEKKISDPHGRLVRLLNFKKGEAKKTIKHFIQQPSRKGYGRAKTLLEQHYGNHTGYLLLTAWLLLKTSDP